MTDILPRALLILALALTAQTGRATVVKRFPLRVDARDIKDFTLSPFGNTVEIIAKGHDGSKLQVGDSLFSTDLISMYMSVADFPDYEISFTPDPEKYSFCYFLDSMAFRYVDGKTYGGFKYRSRSTDYMYSFSYSPDYSDFAFTYIAEKPEPGKNPKYLDRSYFVQTKGRRYGPFGIVNDCKFTGDSHVPAIKYCTGGQWTIPDSLHPWYLEYKGGTMYLAIGDSKIVSFDDDFPIWGAIVRSGKTDSVYVNPTLDFSIGKYGVSGYIAGKGWMALLRNSTSDDLNVLLKKKYTGHDVQYAYVYDRDDQWFAEVNGKVTDGYDCIFGAFNGATCALAMYRADTLSDGTKSPGGMWTIQVAEKQIGRYHTTGQTAVCFNKELTKPVFICRERRDTTLRDAWAKGDRWQVIVNGVAQGPYDQVAQLDRSFPYPRADPGVFTGESDAYRYFYRQGADWHLMDNGTISEAIRADSIAEALFTPKHVLLQYRRGERWYVWDNGKEYGGHPGEKPHRVDNGHLPLYLSFTGNESAWWYMFNPRARGDRDRDAWTDSMSICVNGKDYGPFKSNGTGPSAEASADGKRLAIWCDDGSCIIDGVRYGPYQQLDWSILDDGRVFIAYLQGNEVVIEEVP